MASTLPAGSWSVLSPYLRIGRITASVNAEIAEIAEKRLLGKAVYYPLEAVPNQGPCMEVDQQTYAVFAESKVGKELNRMHTLEALDGLDFEDDRLFDDHVEAIPTVQALILVRHGQWFLPLDAEVCMQEPWLRVLRNY